MLNIARTSKHFKYILDIKKIYKNSKYNGERRTM